MTQQVPAIIRDAAQAGHLTDVQTILRVEHLMHHWGQAHVTDGTGCFCQPREADGVVLHRRMPWESPLLAIGEA